MFGWVEIPVADMDRAAKFYSAVFDIELERHPLGPLEMAWFPGVPGSMGANGSLVKNENYKPSGDGVLVYLTSFSGDVDTELGRVEKAGGKVLMPKKLISEEYGSMGLFLDTEGNRIAVHARKQV